MSSSTEKARTLTEIMLKLSELFPESAFVGGPSEDGGYLIEGFGNDDESGEPFIRITLRDRYFDD